MTQPLISLAKPTHPYIKELPGLFMSQTLLPTLTITDARK
jgi:hypothetical protein